jgi:ABC-type nitrate/sulfonate/bicarbonate transport system ATPase subunit
MSAGVELDHVTVRFGHFTAVDNATLDIKGGEFFSFLGPSGCGKTTILRTVSGFLDPGGQCAHWRAGWRAMAQAPHRPDLPEPCALPLMTVATTLPMA